MAVHSELANHFQLYCCQAYGHYHILSRLGIVSSPCWSRAALIGHVRDLRMTLLDDLNKPDRIDALAELTSIEDATNVLARKRNRVGGKFAPGCVLPYDWQLGEHKVPALWQRFRRCETEIMSFPANGACGGIVVPLFCDFVGRDLVPPLGQSFREAKWAKYADAPARVIPQSELGIEWRIFEIAS